MNVRTSLLAVCLVPAALLAACGTTVTDGHSSTGGGGTGGTGTVGTGAGGVATQAGGAGGQATVGTGGEGGAPVYCATCTAAELCTILNACQFPPSPYVCTPCQMRPYCGSDGKIYDSDCAAEAAGKFAGFDCGALAGSYLCGPYYCNATNEDCQVPSGPFGMPACVPCATTTGRVCGDDGMVYDSACALLQAGHLRGVSCPGFVDCEGVACDTTTSSCVDGEIADCEGGTPVQVCQPGVDAGP
jgi:Kazal-type serine protease inhibitor domain